MKLYSHTENCEYEYEDIYEDEDPRDCDGCTATFVELTIAEALAAGWLLNCRGCGRHIRESGEDDVGAPVEYGGDPFHSPACLVADLAEHALQKHGIDATRAR